MSDDPAASHLLKDLRSMGISDWIFGAILRDCLFRNKIVWLDCNHFLS